jgi:hypothetical protein
MSLQYQDPANTTTTTSPPSSSFTPTSAKKSTFLTNKNFITITTTVTLVFTILSWYYLYALINYLSGCVSSPLPCLGLEPLINQVSTSVELLQSLPSTIGELRADLGEIKKILLYILCRYPPYPTPDIALTCQGFT